MVARALVSGIALMMALAVVTQCDAPSAQDSSARLRDIEDVRARLQSSSPSERFKAIEGARAVAAPELAVLLSSILLDRREAPPLREAAAVALLDIDRPRAQADLRAILEDRRETTRSLENLRVLGIRAVVESPDFRGLGVLARVVDDSTETDAVRVEALSALRAIAPVGFDEPFITLATAAGTPLSVRTAAAGALGRPLWSNRVFPVALTLIHETDLDLVQAALASAARLSQWQESPIKSAPPLLLDRLRELSKTPDRPEIRRNALAVLAARRDEGMLSLFKESVDTEANLDVALSAVGALGALGTQSATGELVRIITDPVRDPRIRASALTHMCGASDTARTYDVAQRVLSATSGNDVERRAAVRCLGRLSDPRALETLKTLATGASVAEDLRNIAVRTLKTKMSERGVVDVLRQIVLNSKPGAPQAPDGVRIAAMEVLADRKPDGGVEELTAVAANPREPESLRLSALGSLKSKTLPAKFLREISLLFLRELTDSVRRGMLSAFGGYEDGEIWSFLRKVMNEPTYNLRLRMGAAESLLGQQPAVLRSSPASGDLNNIVGFATGPGLPSDLRLRLIRGLATVASLAEPRAAAKTAMDALTKVISAPLESRELRLTAIQAVRPAFKTGGQEVVTVAQLLLGMATNEREAPDVRAAAISALREIKLPQIQLAVRGVAADRNQPPAVRFSALDAARGGDDPDGITIRDLLLQVAKEPPDAGDPRPRERATYFLRQFAETPLVFEFLKSTLTDDQADDAMRAWAAAALGWGDTPEAREVIAAAASDKSVLVRWAIRMARAPRPF